MKTLSYLSVLFLLAAGTSCISINPGESVWGNGNVVSEDRGIEDFEGLKVSSGIDVLMKQGSEVSLMLEADENLHDVIKTEVVDHTLRIYTSKNIRKAKAMKVYLTYVDLNSIRISSEGDVKGENTLKTDVLDIDLSSAGDLDLDLEAEEVHCDISSSGDARLSGKTGLIEADLSSAGDLHAYDLIARKCDVSCSSAGDARIYGTEEFDLNCSSAGSIYYRGEGSLVRAKTSSAGSIVKK
jgi:hypothetical protein